MSKKSRMKRGYAILEYAILISTLCMTLIIMFNIMSRHLQGSLKEGVDMMGGELLPGNVKVVGRTYGVLTGRNRRKITVNTFSYEGGQYEGGLSMVWSKSEDRTELNSGGKIVRQE